MVAGHRSRDFRERVVWQKAHTLVLDVYKATESFPDRERFGLVAQLRRSAASVPTNIAEGSGRGGGDFSRFCRIALGSASEMQYQLLLARDLDLLSSPDHTQLDARVIEIKRMLSGLIDKVGLNGNPQVACFSADPTDT